MTSEWDCIELGVWEFPGSLVIRIKCFHLLGGPGPHVVGELKIPQAAQHTQKKKEKKKRHLDVSIINCVM